MAWLAYALFFAYLALMATGDDLVERYPGYFTWPSLASYISVFIGILLHASGLSLPRLALLYKAVFPFSVLMFLAGMWMDSTSPENIGISGTPFWIAILVQVTLMVLPAYWANYRFAFRRRKDRPIDHSVFD
ncbi:MAG TPA: hypothetical protein VGM59_06810 [Dongiaceae bacterium]